MFSIWHVLSVFENTEIQRNPTMTLDKQTLTERQRRLIPFLLRSRSTEEACRRARINKSTVYEWMKDEAFRNELKVMERVMRRGVRFSSMYNVKSGGALHSSLALKFSYRPDCFQLDTPY